MGRLEVTPLGDDRGTLLIRASGRLDAELGRALLRAVASACSYGTARLRVDLCAVRAYDASGALAMSGCRAMARRLPDRVEVVAR